jgi:hypothetical protein
MPTSSGSLWASTPSAGIATANAKTAPQQPEGPVDSESRAEGWPESDLQPDGGQITRATPRSLDLMWLPGWEEESLAPVRQPRPS